MFAHFNEYDLQKARVDDMRRAAEQYDQAQDTPSAPFYASTLVSVGKVLVEVGSKLQEQYEPYQSGQLTNEVNYRQV